MLWRLAAAYVAGTFLTRHTWLLAPAVVALLACGHRKTRPVLERGMLPALACAFLLGLLSRPAAPPSLPAEGREVIATGWIASRPEGTSALQTCFLRLEALQPADAKPMDAKPTDANDAKPQGANFTDATLAEWTDRLVRVRWRGRLPPYGSRCRLYGRLRSLRPPRNFFAYDERAALGSQAATGVLQVARFERLPGTRGPAWRRELIEPLRERLLRRLLATLAAEEAGIFAALTLGVRDATDWRIAEAWRALGVSHVLSISGMHVALVGGVLLAVAGTPRRRRGLVALLGGLAAYTALGGCGPTLLRASLMAAWGAFALYLGRSPRPLLALGFASAVLLLPEPHRRDDLGLQLSCLSTFGILLWARPLARAASLLGSGSWGRRLLGWMVLNAGVGVAAQTATLPLVLWRFGYVPWIAPLANLVLVPLTNFALLLGLAGLPLALASDELSRPLWLVGAGILRIAIWLSLQTAARVESRLFLPTHALALVLAFTGAAALLAAGRWANRRHVCLTALASAALSAILLCLHAGAPAQPAWRLEVLDVGQGDALVLTLDERTWVIDAGERRPIDQGARTLVPHLRRQGIRRLRGLVLTHPHADHCGGAASLLGALGVDTLYVPRPGRDDAQYTELRAAAPRVPVRALAAGERLQLAPDYEAHVLWPEAADRLGSGPNALSIVLWARGAGHPSLLAMGDLEADGEAAVLEAWSARLQAAADELLVLKVGHHGSRTSSSVGFLDAIDAELALVSVGEGNRYGHPAAETLSALDAHGCLVLRTDRGGAIRLERRGQALWLERPGGRGKPLDMDGESP